MPPRFSFSSAARTSSTLFGRTMLLMSFISRLQHTLESFLELSLFAFFELSTRLRHMQHVNGLPPFSPNQRQIQIATVLGDDAAHPIQQSRTIVCHDLENGVLARVFVVGVNPRRLRYPPAIQRAPLASTKQRRDVDGAGNDAVEHSA